MTIGSGHEDAPAAGRAECRTPRTRAAFSLLAATQLVLIMAITMLAVVLPRVEAELGLSAGRLTLVNAAYGLSFSGLLLLGGRAADLYGPRRLFTTGLVLFGAASITAGVAPGFWTLAISRFLQGAGAALAAPAAVALVGVVFPEPRRRARALAAWGGLSPLGAAAGVLSSGVIAGWVSWRWVFAVPVVAAVLVLALTSSLLPADGRTVRGGLDLRGAVLATAGLTALSYGLVHAAERSWFSLPVLGPLTAGVVLLTSFILAERKAADPLLPPAFLGSGRRLGALWVILVGATAISTVLMLLSLYFQQVKGMSPLGTAAAFLPFSLLLLLTGLIVTRLVNRFGPRVVAVVGSLLAAGGAALLGGTTADGPYAGALLAGLLVLPVGISMMFSGATVRVLSPESEERAGLAGSLVNTAMETGPTAGLALLVSLATARTDSLLAEGAAPRVAETSGYSFAFDTAALVLLGTAAVALWTLRGTGGRNQ
ncbi:Major Facilitator Superfamily protein [Actinopolyspora mzabensis]|uniref:Major Facilitator Superfamily protein n=1 Tax=Actinopolyspora mzabensis TaxID=995066 RepID=A0A1G9FPD0_ACTMZ|nr:MFS transporter [Actinopolyspora mzabensis]SDK90276.1 Major Facilitator Superfamily protein [Actinopolyspora mzabensis]